MKEVFNYIIPIFNKEDILPLTLEGIHRCTSPQATIYTVIDGCTDKSEHIVDEFKIKTGRNIIKIHMPDVHMLRSVNAALKIVEEGFSVIMQDDIILEDVNFEHKIINLYKKMGTRLGVISTRVAANVRLTPIHQRLPMRSLWPMIQETDFLMGKSDSQHYPSGEYEQFYPRISAINGPNIIPWTVKQEIGLFDDNLAPYGYDDPEYCLRAMKAGYINGLFPLKYRSDEEWGGTRRSKKFLAEVRKIHSRNRQYVWKKHGNYINFMKKNLSHFTKNFPIEDLSKIPRFTYP